MLSKREKYLMKVAFSVGSQNLYVTLDQWLNDSVDDSGHCVEDVVDTEADYDWGDRDVL